MTLTPSDPFFDIFVREYVQGFSKLILNMEYDDLKKIVYPNPRYRSFIISKRNGEPRIIDEPLKKLKAIQRTILAFLEAQTPSPRTCVHGFVRRRSILTNAQQHCSTRIKHVLNVDLESFFSSITFKRVRGALRKRPFYFSHSVATLIAHICTRNGVLPQGAPTSPFLSNIICRGLDRDLSDLARRCRATYTRYADDISFSLDHPQKEKLPRPLCIWEHLSVKPGEELVSLINKHGFTINTSKTRISDRTSRMEVTGLTVNQFPNVRRSFVDKIRGALHAWDVYGYDSAQETWQQKIALTASGQIAKRAWQRQTRTNAPPKLKNVLWGRLLYLRMVRGRYDLLYTRLAEKYNLLCECERLTRQFQAPSLPIEPLAQDIPTAEDAVFQIRWDAVTKDGCNVSGDGTAFAYGELNLLVTCAHLLEGDYSYSDTHKFHVDHFSDELIQKSITVNRPRTNESFPARVLYVNKQFDVALIAFDMAIPPTHKFFAPSTNPIEIRAPGKLIGFPAYRRGNLPDFLDEKVLNLIEPNRQQKLFTITGAGAIRPGNSGGPFVDEQFKVAGIAQQGAFNGDGHDICLASSVLDELIASWKRNGSKELEPLKIINTAMLKEPNEVVIEKGVVSINCNDKVPSLEFVKLSETNKWHVGLFVKAATFLNWICNFFRER